MTGEAGGRIKFKFNFSISSNVGLVKSRTACLAFVMEKNLPVVLDRSDPLNVINLVPTRVGELMEELYKKHPEYLNMSEEQICQDVLPDETTEILRMYFWIEFNRALDSGQKMRMRNVYYPNISRVRFYTYYLVDPKKLAWIVTPVQDHLSALKAHLDRGRQQIAKVMRTNIFFPDGRLDNETAKNFIKIYSMIENRVMGASVQRTHVITERKESANDEKIVEALQTGEIVETEKIEE